MWEFVSLFHFYMHLKMFRKCFKIHILESCIVYRCSVRITFRICLFLLQQWESHPESHISPSPFQLMPRLLNLWEIQGPYIIWSFPGCLAGTAPTFQSLKERALTSVAQLAGCGPRKVKVTDLIPSQGTLLSYGFHPRTRSVRVATHQCFYLTWMFLSLFLPPFPSLKINKIFKKQQRNPFRTLHPLWLPRSS